MKLVGIKQYTEDEKVGWHHQFNGHEFEQALGDGEGQGTWRAAVHGVAKSQTRLNDWTTTNNIHSIKSEYFYFLYKTALKCQDRLSVSQEENFGVNDNMCTNT